MALDAVMLRIAAEELKENLTDARVDRIFMPARDTVVINVRNKSGVKRLLLSARSGMARAHFTKQEYDNPATPPAFCMLLRKYLQSGRIKDVRAADGERILFFDFEVLNETGDRTCLSVSMELMGRYSNLVLINSKGIIIDALKHVVSEQDGRRVVPGAEFCMPTPQHKLPFMSSGVLEMLKAVKEKEKPLSAALLDAVAGIGPVVCREISFRSAADDTPAHLLDADSLDRLSDTLDFVKRAAEGQKTRRLSIVSGGEGPIEFSFIPLTQYRGLSVTEFDSLSELLDCFYASRERALLLLARSSDLKKQVGVILERAVRRQRSREQELMLCEKADMSKLCGELLTVYIGQLKKGMSEATVLNYYDNTDILIKLDPQKTPSQNAQKYYRDYRKMITARQVLTELLIEGEKEISYIESVRYAVETAETEAEFLSLRRELKEAGYLKSYRLPKTKPAKTDDLFRYMSSEGHRILAGKNNIANDRLTLRSAAKSDIWFHVKNDAGSHVILFADGKKPGDAALAEAAMIAAFHSKSRMSENVAVDFTEAKNVKKAPGQRPGMVVYTDYKTIFVTPNAKTPDGLK